MSAKVAREEGLEALRTGRFAEALAAFGRAADEGDAEARAYLALLHLRGLGIPYDPERAFRLSEEAWRAGVVHAGLTLATLLYGGQGTAPDRERALGLLRETAARGHPPALRILGLLRLGAREPEEAGALLAAAARGGDGFALHTLALLALEARRPREAVPLLVAAARSGLLPSRLRLRRFQKEEGEESTRELALLPPALPAADPRAVCAALDAPLPAAAPSPSPTRLLAEAIGLRHARRVLHPAECDYLLAVAAPFLRPAETTDPRDGKPLPTPLRTSLATNLHPSQEDLLALRIEEKILAVLAPSAPAPPALAATEPLAVLHYAPGQEYRPHYDAYPPAALRDPALAAAGQRTHTLLAYLSDACEGGATAFPRLGITLAPETGAVAVFRNADADGRPLEESLHAGEPVRAGEKWLATLWVRERPGARAIPRPAGSPRA